jgi:hypothetical protein
MINASQDSLLISANLSKAIYHGAFEMLGQFELKKTWDLDVSSSDHRYPGLTFSEVNQLLVRFIQQYGLPTVQGILLRIGRETFQNLRRNNPEIGFNKSIERRMQPLHKRLNSELTKLLEWMQLNTSCQYQVVSEDNKRVIHLTFKERFEKEIRTTIFYFYRGVIEACLDWVENLYRYRIELVSDLLDDQRTLSISVGYQQND